MAFYAGRLVRDPAMENPTIVVLTDHNYLDEQLSGTFARCADRLRQPPVQVESRADLRAKLAVQAGDVVFTTVQYQNQPGDSAGPTATRLHLPRRPACSGIYETNCFGMSLPVN